MQSSPSPGLDLAETTRPQPPLLPLQFSSFPPTPEQCHIPQPGFLAPSPACTEFVGLQACQSRAKEQLGLPGRSLPCGHLVLAPHLVLGAAFVPGPAAVWVQLCTQRGAEQPWVVALHSWGAPGRSGGTSVGFVTAFPTPFCLGQGRAELPEGPSDQSVSRWLEQFFLPRAVPRSASWRAVTVPAISPCSVCSHALFPHAAKANHAYLRLLEHVRLPGTRAPAHGHMVAVTCPAPRLPRARAHDGPCPPSHPKALGC